MDWQAALIAGLGLPALATVLGLAWRSRTGRLHRVAAPATATATAPAPAAAEHAATDAAAPRSATEDPRATAAAALDLDEPALGASATLVQFSTEYCSRCPATARQLAELAGDYEGVRHVEIDLTHRADLADRFHVRQTPTTLVLAADGATTARIGGVPRLDAVRSHLETLTRRHHVAS